LTGSFKYKHAVGKKDHLEEKPIEEDAMFLLASQTKLLTTIAALQIVERGLFRLDDDVTEKLPELGAHKILQGFDEDDKPILVERKKAITLKSVRYIWVPSWRSVHADGHCRHLLTHSAGCAYDGGAPTLIKYQKQRGRELGVGPTVPERYDYPLLFEPGTGWMYGANMDW